MGGGRCWGGVEDWDWEVNEGERRGLGVGSVYEVREIEEWT